MTRSRKDFDTIIVGAGLAGASSAIVLSSLGYRVAVIEAGMNEPKRLSGELIQPTGFSTLCSLGLESTLSESGARSVKGMVIYARELHQIASSPSVLLPYDAVPGRTPNGVTVRHDLLKATLVRTLSRTPGVTLLLGERVTSLEQQGAGVTVTITSPAGKSRRTAELVVAADGRSSTVRRLAGIQSRQQRLSMMYGLVLKDVQLPHSGYGHTFLGGAGLTLAYEIGERTVRVLFDVPQCRTQAELLMHCRASLAHLPDCIRVRASEEIESQTGLVTLTHQMSPNALVFGRVVLVGDAAGCCHPLTATGLTACARDAQRLAKSLEIAQGDFDKALVYYERNRPARQRTRFALCKALYEVFCGSTPEFRFMRSGLLNYLIKSKKGRAAAMSLLTAQEERFMILARETGRVMLHSISGSGFRTWRKRQSLGIEGAGAWIKLLRILWQHAGTATRVS